MIDPIVKNIADNPALFDALKSMFTAESKIDVVATEGKNNEELGQIVRARMESLEIIDSVFKKILTLRTVGNVSNKRNEAR